MKKIIVNLGAILILAFIVVQNSYSQEVIPAYCDYDYSFPYVLPSEDCDQYYLGSQANTNCRGYALGHNDEYTHNEFWSEIRRDYVPTEEKYAQVIVYQGANHAARRSDKQAFPYPEWIQATDGGFDEVFLTRSIVERNQWEGDERIEYYRKPDFFPIYGPNIIRTDRTFVYTTPDEGTLYSWIASSNIEILSFQGNEVAVRGIQQGTATLTLLVYYRGKSIMESLEITIDNDLYPSSLPKIRGENSLELFTQSEYKSPFALGIESYNWSVTNQPASNYNLVYSDMWACNFMPNKTGTYMLELVIEQEDGYYTLQSKTITVENNYSISGPSSIPVNLFGIYTMDEVPNSTYAWSVSPTSGTSISPSGNTCAFSSSNPGTYTLTVITTTPYEQLVNTKTITISKTILKSGNTDMVENSEVLFKPAFSVYPNPNNGKFNLNINSDSESDIDVKVLNTIGQTIYKQKFTNSNNVNEIIELENVKNGIYFVQVSNGDFTKIERIVITQ